MPTDAYGEICQFFPPRLDPAENKGVEALAAAVEGMDNVARSLGDSNTTYRDGDQRHAENFRGGLT